jgi:hypothetical protein
LIRLERETVPSAEELLAWLPGADLVRRGRGEAVTVLAGGMAEPAAMAATPLRRD